MASRVPIIALVCVAVRRYRQPGWMVATLIRVATFVLVVYFRLIDTIQVGTYYGGCDYVRTPDRLALVVVARLRTTSSG